MTEHGHTRESRNGEHEHSHGEPGHSHPHHGSAEQSLHAHTHEHSAKPSGFQAITNFANLRDDLPEGFDNRRILFLDCASGIAGDPTENGIHCQRQPRDQNAHERYAGHD